MTGIFFRAATAYHQSLSPNLNLACESGGDFFYTTTHYVAIPTLQRSSY